MILTRTPAEAASAWDRGEIRGPYPSRAAFLAYCDAVNQACRALGRTPYGGSAAVKEEQR